MGPIVRTFEVDTSSITTLTLLKAAFDGEDDGASPAVSFTDSFSIDVDTTANTFTITNIHGRDIILHYGTTNTDNVWQDLGFLASDDMITLEGAEVPGKIFKRGNLIINGNTISHSADGNVATIVSDINNANVPYIRAYENDITGGLKQLEIRNTIGADIVVDEKKTHDNESPWDDLGGILNTAGTGSVDLTGTGNGYPYKVSGKAWTSLKYISSSTSPSNSPIDGRLWYNTSFQVDIMVNRGGWKGFKNAFS